MASVKIDSGPPSANQRPHELPKEKWFILMQEKRSFIKTRIPYDCRCLLDFIQDAKEMFEALGFKSVQDMIENGYELDAAEVDLAYEWLLITSPETAVGYDTAVEGGRKLRDRPGAPEGNKNACKDKNNCSNTTIVSEDIGRGKDYLLARIERDTPEILEKYKQGEFPSVRQAAIAAGIVKIPTPLEIAIKAFSKLSYEEKEVFIKTISG